MTEKTWHFELEDGQHVVELDHGYFSGKRKIRLDGAVILESAETQHLVFDTGSVHEFHTGSHPCAVIIRTNGITFSYDLAVDGRSITTGQPLDALPPRPAWLWLLVIGSLSLFLCGGVVLIALLMIMF